jgi:hypothetical protein
MTKEIAKKEESKPEKKYGVAEAKDFILYYTKSSTDPDENLKKFAEKYMPVVYSGKYDEKTQDEMIRSISDLSTTFSTDTGYILMESLGKDYHGLAIQMRRELQQEFDCKKPSEKALVDMVVNAFIKKLSYSKRMENNQKYVGAEYDGYRNYLSKEIDRAHRQFLSAMETLNIIKQPALKVNIKTNNAFVSENQQFNTKVENNETK